MPATRPAGPRRAVLRGVSWVLAVAVGISLLQGVAIARPPLPPPPVDLVDPLPGGSAGKDAAPPAATLTMPPNAKAGAKIQSADADVVLPPVQATAPPAADPAPGGPTVPSAATSPSEPAAEPPSSAATDNATNGPTGDDADGTTTTPAPSADPATTQQPDQPATPATGLQIDASAVGPSVDAGDAGIEIAQVGAGEPEKVTVEVIAATDGSAAAGDAPMLIVTPSDGSLPPLQLSIPSTLLAGEYGADYAARITWAAYPAGAIGDQEQQVEVAQSVVGEQTVLATADPQAGALALVATASSGEGAGGTGSFAATSLTPSASYKVAEQTGAFTWSYPMTGPAPAAGSAPGLALVYNSAAVDGRTGSTNNQASAAGEGWEIGGLGFIERQYTPCSTDPAGSVATGDLCWHSENATLQLDGHSGELIRDTATGQWRLESDDGSTIQKLTGASNGDNDGEHWVITTTDGTRYYFGLDKLPGYTAGMPITNSAWTAPVYGNQAGEPCATGTFATSSCTQAWRWNLDYVVDVHGNSQAFYYTTETNRYAANKTNSNATAYVRGGQIARIDYGMRAGAELTTPAPYRIILDSADRCLPGSTCSTTAPGSDWPDVPWDQSCAAAPCTNKYTPTFWASTRISAVHSQYYTGSGYANVDTWALNHSYPNPGDNTSATLWLASITRTGHTNGDITLPPVTFTGVPLENRVWATDGLAPLVKFRIANITTETGAVIAIAYSAKQCSPTSLPASPETNTMRCFPQWWSQEGVAPRLDYFHKYVVTTLSANPGYGNALQTTTYSYTGTPAWTYNDNPTTPADKRTWAAYAGYNTVQVLVGDTSAPQSVERTGYVFYQGLHGDRASPAGGTKTKTITTSDGTTTTDEKWLAGQIAETTTYNGQNGPVAEAATTTYWASPPTATNTATTHAARYVRPAATTTRIPLGTGGSRVLATTTSYDPAGRPVAIDDRGDTATPGDDICTRISYAPAASTGVQNLRTEEIAYATSCSVAAAPANVVTATKTFFDGATSLSTPPVKGLPTRVETAVSTSGDGIGYALASTTTYDALGRPLVTTDGNGHTSATVYTPVGGGVTTKLEVTNQLGHELTTFLDPARGLPIAQLDGAGKRTDATLDALGRVTQVWLPGRDKAANPTPSMSYGYTITAGQPPSIATTSLTPSGGTATSHQIFDALLQERQTQKPAEGGGRVISESRIDAAGRTIRISNPYYTTGAPSGALFQPGTALPGEVVTTFDGLGRPVIEIQMVNNASAWTTAYAYDGQSITTTPPAGAAATRKIVDGRGRMIALWTYHANTPDGGYDATTYTHTPTGRLATVVDAAGNTWSWTYDLRGNQLTATDPDAGTTTSSYDNVGNKISSTDSRGVTITTTYDQLNRVTATYDGDLSANKKLTSYVYDTIQPGMPTSQTRHDPSGDYVKTITGYTAAGMPSGTSMTIPSSAGPLAGTYTTTYAYTQNNQIASETYSAIGGLPTEKVTTNYTDLGNPTRLTAGLTVAVSSITYTHLGEVGQIAQTSANAALYHTYTYATGTRRLEREQITTTSSTLADRAYTYTPAGTVTSIKDTASATHGGTDTQCFTYDHAQRLTEAWTPTSGSCAAAPSQSGLGGPAPYWTSYTYDLTGNRTSTTAHPAGTGAATTTAYTYDPSRPHLLTATSDGNTYTHDTAGNTTSRTVNGQTTTSQIGPDGHVQKATDASGAAVQENVYDTNGQLLLRKEGGKTTLYIGPTDTTHDTATGQTTTTRTYTINGQPVATRSKTGFTTTTSWVDANSQGTITATHTTTGTTAKRYLDPFGNTRGTPTAWLTNRALLNKPLSPTTGLQRFGVRDYDPTTGRFTSHDPIIDPNNPQQLNGYNYANNNPVTLSDPDGLAPCGPWTASKRVCGSLLELIINLAQGKNAQKNLPTRKQKAAATSGSGKPMPRTPGAGIPSDRTVTVANHIRTNASNIRSRSRAQLLALGPGGKPKAIGDIGEKSVKDTLEILYGTPSGLQQHVYFNVKDLGKRYVDILTEDGIAIEVKTGAVDIDRMKLQIQKDLTLLDTGQVDGLVYVFIYNPVSNQGKNYLQVQELLQSVGISYVFIEDAAVPPAIAPDLEDYED